MICDVTLLNPIFFLSFFKSTPEDVLTDFRERGKDGRKGEVGRGWGREERERNIDVKEKHQ